MELKNLFSVRDEEYWEILKNRVWDMLDFDTREYSDKFIRRRIEGRMRHLSINSFREYADTLVTDRGEAEHLFKSLNIHVTHFFRDRSMYNELKSRVLPELIETKKKSVANPMIRVWSAGCSTGEEPISVLICLLEVLKDGADRHFISIIGTDRDKFAIKKAKEGLYEPVQFRETEEGYLEKYFILNDENHISLKPEYRKYISYEVGDIISEYKMMFDIILCRNTVIYFHPETKTRLYLRFFEALNPGGFFIMGKTEILLGKARERFETFNLRERIFRKPLSR